MTTESNFKNTPNETTVVLMRGLPGSGKSYLTTELLKSIDTEATVLDPDAIDKNGQEYHDLSAKLTEQGIDLIFHPHQFLLSRLRKAFASRHLVIWNQPFTNRGGFQRTIAAIQRLAHEAGLTLKILVVEVEVDEATAKQRVQQRKASGGHGPSDATFAHRAGEYVSFADEGHKTISVQGHGDVSKNVQAVLEALRQL